MAAVPGPHAPNLIPLSIFGFVNAMTLGIWMSDGWEVSASAGEEVASDNRSTGRGGIIGLIITTVVLVPAMVSYLHLAPPGGFADRQADVLDYVGNLLGGGPWRVAILATVLVSTCSTLWTTVLYLSRSVYAMGRDGLLPHSLGRLDRRSEPLIALATLAVLLTIFQIATGFFESAAEQLDIVLNISSVFLGLLFVLSAAACVKRFRGVAGAALAGVWVPAIGAVALLVILVATVYVEEPRLQLYAWGGVVLGIPFALWRGRTMARAGVQGSNPPPRT